MYFNFILSKRVKRRIKCSVICIQDKVELSALFDHSKTPHGCECNKKLASNYRPVSITSVLCRILEKLIRNKIVEYMQSENLLSDLQFGFIKGRSTSLQLLNMSDWTGAIENSNSSDCFYLDYQKTFDTVPHKRLISKLSAYNIDEKIINWI